MDINKKLTLGPDIYSHILDMMTPTWITTAEGLTFDWFEEDGCYGNRGPEAVFLYMEVEEITPDSYYEILPI